MTQMMDWISGLWCRNLHDQAMWPIHGKYVCPRCLREYPVSWEGLPKRTEYADPGLQNAGIPATQAELNAMM
jgi:hypothetical protein